MAQCFKRVGAELRQFIQEKHAPVGKREFARSRRRTSTDKSDKTGMADGVMGRAKGSASHQRFVGRQQSGNRVDLGYLKGLIGGQGRQDPRKAPGQEGLACTGTAGYQEVVSAGRSDLEGALGVFLPAHSGKVLPNHWAVIVQVRTTASGERRDRFLST